MPTLTVIAGPNGSGKSTLTRSFEIEGRGRLLDPAAIARDLNPLNPSAAAMAAGREVLIRTANYLDFGLSFAIKTTLSSGGRLEPMRNAKSRGYAIHLVFIALDSAERCITRVRTRAAQGGHSVPEADVRRRYFRSTANAAEALRLVDTARFYDNSGDGHRPSWWRTPVSWCGGRRQFRIGPECEAAKIAARTFARPHRYQTEGGGQV